MAPIYLLLGDNPAVAWARLESACLGTLAVAGVFFLGRHLFDPQVGLLAALMAALYPGGIALSALVLSEAPFLRAPAVEPVALVRGIQGQVG